MCKAEDIRGSHHPVPIRPWPWHLRAAVPPHCFAFCSHCSPSGLKKLHLRSKRGFEHLMGRGRSPGSNLANSFKRLANPGDPALGPDRALCFGLGWWWGPPAAVGPHCQLVASFPKEDLVTKRSWKFLCTQAETWRPCKGPRVRIKEKQNRNPSISN